MPREERNSDTRERYRRKKKKIGPSPKTIIVLFILLIAIASAAYVLIDKYMPNFKQVDYRTYYSDIHGNETFIIFKDEMIALTEDEVDTMPINNYAEIKDELIYLPVDFIKTRIDEYIFWDKEVNRLTVTTEDKVIQMRTEELAYLVNHEPFYLDIPVANINEAAYLPPKLLKDLYDVSVDYNDEYNFVTVDLDKENKDIYTVHENKANLRYEANIKSPIAYKLVKGDRLIYYGDNGVFSKVRTEEGLIGYVEADRIEYTETIVGITKPDISDEEIPREIFDGKINMVWVTNTNSESAMDLNPDLDVVSPTWFSFDEESQAPLIINKADDNYVSWAKDMGYQIWPLITDNFNSEVSHNVLADTNNRENVIKQLLALVSIHNLDGINIDFENVKKEDAEYYVQFFRELYPLMKQQGAALSVDLYVPMEHNLYYNRTEVGKVVDYFIIMGYDEHWSTSPISGPNASIGFVESGIKNTMEEVDKEKIILAMPYYVRVWREIIVDGEVEVSSRSFSMERAYNQFIEAGAEFYWDEEVKAYYSEYETEEEGETVLYRTWLEDERSIEEKMKLVNSYDIAGISGWQSGFEKREVWTVLDNYLRDK